MKDGTKWLIILGFVLESLLLAHFYSQYRFADRATQSLLIGLQQSNEYFNDQCVTLLGRKGFQVIKTPPPEPEPEEEEEKEDGAKR